MASAPKNQPTNTLLRMCSYIYYFRLYDYGKNGLWLYLGELKLIECEAASFLLHIYAINGHHVRFNDSILCNEVRQRYNVGLGIVGG